jgi:hypothetical protein
VAFPSSYYLKQPAEDMTTSVYSGSARPPSSTGVGKKKRRRMKQMEGLLLMSRPKLDDAALAAMARNTDDQLKPRVVKPKKVHVMLQPQQLQLTYSAQVRTMAVMRRVRGIRLTYGIL